MELPTEVLLLVFSFLLPAELSTRERRQLDKPWHLVLYRCERTGLSMSLSLPFVLCSVSRSWRYACLLHEYWRLPFQSTQHLRSCLLASAKRELLGKPVPLRLREPSALELANERVMDICLLRLLCQDLFRLVKLAFPLDSLTDGDLLHQLPPSVQAQMDAYLREIREMALFE